MRVTRQGCCGKQYLLLGMLFLLVITGQTGCTGLDYTLMAKGHYEAKRYDEAISSAKKAVALDPKFAPAWFWLGVSYYAKTQWDEATSAFEKVIELKAQDPQFTDSHMFLGNAYFNKAQYEKAVDAYQRYIKLAPQEVGYNNLGFAYEKLGRYDEAIRTYERAIELGKAGDKTRQLLRAAREQRARQYFLRALSADKEGDLKRAFIELTQAWTLSNEGCDWGEASDIVKKVEAKVVSEFRQGEELMKRRDPVEAVRHFRVSLEFSWAGDKELIRHRIADYVHFLSEPLEPPEEARKLFGYGMAAADQKDYAAAAKYFAQSAELAVWWPEARYNAARMAGELKQYEEAIRQMKEYVLMVPPSIDVRPAKQKIYEWEYQLKRATESSQPSGAAAPGSGLLGIRMFNASALVAFLYGLPDTKGVWVIEVISGSTAEEIGVKPGDMILEINGRRVDCMGNFLSQWRSIKSGERFSLRLMRLSGQQRSEPLTLAGVKR